MMTSGMLSSVLSSALDVIVYLVNDEAIPLTVDGLSAMTAHDLHRAIREVLALPDIAQEVFALWLVSPFLGNKRIHLTFITSKQL